MIADSLADTLVDKLRRIYADDPGRASQRFEALLTKSLGDPASQNSREALQQLIRKLRPLPQSADSTDNQVMSRVFSLLLGKQVAPDDLSSAELLERLAQSLNTIFDTLNRLIGVINHSFTGVESGDQTIRQFIGFHLEGEDQTQSLEAYLGQINQAFLMTHEAFKSAARDKVGQILKAVDPSQVAAERSSGLKLGPLRKAEYYDILKEKIERIQKWYDSGRFMEDFLREFENNCQSFNRK